MCKQTYSSDIFFERNVFKGAIFETYETEDEGVANYDVERTKK